MIIWLILFVIIILISFILAYLSMRDYQEIPEKKLQYSVYLIQNPEALNSETLNGMHQSIKRGEILSLERLFKGEQSALVIFGPKPVLQNLESLNLLELEDYTGVKGDDALAWELTLRDQGVSGYIFNQMPELETEEQFWWQIVLQTYSKNYLSELIDRLRGLQPLSDNKAFQAQIRAVLVVPSEQRRKKLKVLLENLADNLIKIPRPYTSLQILEFYTQRSFTPVSFGVSALSSSEVLALLGKR